MEIPDVAGVPAKFQIGLVLGASGSGKTRFLKKHFGEPVVAVWNHGQAIVSQVSQIDPTPE